MIARTALGKAPTAEFCELQSPAFPSPPLIALCRSYVREPMAEFLGVALLVIFGAGSGASVVLSTSPGVSSSSKGVRSI